MAGTRRPVGAARADESTAPELPTLPPVTVARLEETGALLERLFDENVAMFVRKGQEFKERHRESTTRPLLANEAVQLAAALAETEGEESDDRVTMAEQLQASDLRAYEQPDKNDILFAAGLATSPALMAAVRKVVALVEMPVDVFERASIDGKLAAAIDEAATKLRHLEAAEARARASAALRHYAAAAGYEAGEAWRLPVQAVWQALRQAVESLAGGSASTQLIRSAASTADSPATTSSTGSPGPTRSS